MRSANNHKYDDIIGLPHHVSTTRPQMSMLDRAAQFSPFAALSGYDAAIEETARLTDQYIELDEDHIAALNEKLLFLRERMDERPEITVTYFEPDERKTGGAYVSVTERVKKIDDYARMIVLTSGTKIPLENTLEIESDIFCGHG